MTQEDRLFELEKTLEVVLDLFEDHRSGAVWINGEVEQADGMIETMVKLPATDAAIINNAITLLYTDEEIDE